MEKIVTPFGDVNYNKPVFITPIKLNLSLRDIKIKNNTNSLNVDIKSLIKNNNSTLYVKPKPSNSIIKLVTNNYNNSTIKVSNINENITKEDLIQLFEKFGNIRKITITKGKTYGFISYYDNESTIKAVKEMNKYKYDHMILDVTIPL